MKTNTLLDNLIAQTNNPAIYPNILAQKFQSLTRNLQTYWDVTYGLNDMGVITNQLPVGTAGPVKANRKYLVIAVQGKNLTPGTKNTGPQSRNIIFIANQVYNPPVGKDMLLYSPNNQGVSVKLWANRGNGAFEVTVNGGGNLVTDVLAINASNASPYIEVTVDPSTGL